MRLVKKGDIPAKEGQFSWLLAHGQWKRIDDFISWEDCEDVRDKEAFERFLPSGYTEEGWRIRTQEYQVYVYGKYVTPPGPGIEQHPWERDSEQEIAYLISITTPGAWEVLYAQTLPDMLQILALLSSIVQAHSPIKVNE